MLSLSRFALVDEDNIVYTQYTTYTGGSRHEFLNSEKMEDRVISTIYLYGSSKELCLAVPVNDLTVMGKRFKACFVQIDIKDIVELLAFEDKGRTNFGIYSKNGGNLSGTDLGPDISKRNIFDATRDFVKENDWEELCDNFANEAGGSLAVRLSDTVETISYVPIPEAEWEMVVMIQESVIHDQIKAISDKSMQIRKYQIIITFIALILFALVLMIQIGQISREKLEAEKENSKNALRMANMDSMTGVRNKHAYSEAEMRLNEQIMAKEADNLAVLVCDVNGLKYVNDTQGHEAGDKLIKDACALICEHFKNGSVFRVGGDEFVVLLQGKGFEIMEETIRAFNQKAEENIRGNGVVVSLSYAVLEPEDEYLSDIFGRADQRMYERKKELKGMGAKTRES
ncbi:MAG: GGDEF domain-containing protein [Lachnospiraceae bacterium]|nr:GGDEF domain-containing protein [Lachnospiraceae bacterium]